MIKNIYIVLCEKVQFFYVVTIFFVWILSLYAFMILFSVWHHWLCRIETNFISNIIITPIHTYTQINSACKQTQI